MQLDKYQEQPNVLDSVLETIVVPLIDFIKFWVRKSVAAKIYTLSLDV